MESATVEASGIESDRHHLLVLQNGDEPPDLTLSGQHLKYTCHS